MQHIPYNGIIPFSYDYVKTCFKNSDYITENLLRRMELFGLPILESGNLNLKACAFKFLNINIEKLKIKALQCLYSIYS